MKNSSQKQDSLKRYMCRLAVSQAVMVEDGSETDSGNISHTRHRGRVLNAGLLCSPNNLCNNR